jgi:predicted house-cleaning noncanonical NTP pyrophosphatase (MazG superfamily)
MYNSLNERRNSQEVEIAAGLIDDMMREMMQKLFVSSATNYVAEEGPKDTDLNTLLQEVVDPRIEEMPGDIIPLLDSYISAVQETSDSEVEVLQLLLILKNYIVDKASEKLPISMKVLQNLLDAQRCGKMCAYCIFGMLGNNS